MYISYTLMLVGYIKFEMSSNLVTVITFFPEYHSGLIWIQTVFANVERERERERERDWCMHIFSGKIKVNSVCVCVCVCVSVCVCVCVCV